VKATMALLAGPVLTWSPELTVMPVCAAHH